MITSGYFFDSLIEIGSLLPEPRRSFGRLFQPSLQRLSSDIIVSYLQAGLKVFSYWASNLAQGWSSGMIDDFSSAVASLLIEIEPFTLHSDVEVRERVRPFGNHLTDCQRSLQALNAAQLLKFVMMDAKSHQFQPNQDSKEVNIESPVSGVAQPDYPKGLYLVEPLFSSYAIQPIADKEEAQQISSDAPLDLDTWMIPSIKAEIEEPVYIEELLEPTLKPKGKGKKSKGKLKGKRKERETTQLSTSDNPAVSGSVNWTSHCMIIFIDFA